MNIQDIQSDIKSGVYTSTEVRNFLRSSIQTAFDSTKGTEQDADNHGDFRDNTAWEAGYNAALTEIKQRQDEFMKGGE